MKSLFVVSSLLALGSCATPSSSSLWNQMRFSVEPEGEKSPDEHVSFDRWQAEGVYTLRLSPTEIQEESVRMFGFHKIWNGQERKFKIEAYPISSPELTPDPMMMAASTPIRGHREAAGPVVMFGCGEHVYVVTSKNELLEEPEKGGVINNDVKCHKYPMRITKSNPLKNAKYRGLTFEHNTLCHQYSDISYEHEYHGRDWQCKVEDSELFLDAFNHRPVELHLDGHLIRRKEGEEDNDQMLTNRRRFLSNVFFYDFEFNPARKEEKEELSMPETLHHLCKDATFSNSDLEDFLPLLMF
jgi:hypothetical protein